MEIPMSNKILVVEDHPGQREVLGLQLRRMGYEVFEAADGEIAVEKALVEKPDLIIMDLWLPGINGIQAAVRLKQNPKTAHIPVIAYTAAEHKDCKDMALQSGMAEFLMKPTHPQIFKDVIEKLLGKRL